MAGYEESFLACGVDPLLLLAISINESNMAKAYSEEFNSTYKNAFGLSYAGKLIKFDSWHKSITKACDTVVKLMGDEVNIPKLGSRYAEDPKWSTKVASIYSHLTNI